MGQAWREFTLYQKGIVSILLAGLVKSAYVLLLLIPFPQNDTLSLVADFITGLILVLKWIGVFLLAASAVNIRKAFLERRAAGQSTAMLVFGSILGIVLIGMLVYVLSARSARLFLDDVTGWAGGYMIPGISEKTASLVGEYSPDRPGLTADALKEFWLGFEPNRGIELIKAEQRLQFEAAGTPIPVLKAIGRDGEVGAQGCGKIPAAGALIVGWIRTRRADHRLDSFGCHGTGRSAAHYALAEGVMRPM